MNSKPVVNEITKKIRVELEYLNKKNIKPRLAIIRIGESSDAVAYEKGTKKRFDQIGIEIRTYFYHKDINQIELIKQVQELNTNEDIHGILLLKPLPPQIDTNTIIKLMNPIKDMDGMNPTNLGKVVTCDKDGFPPCTPEAVMRLLNYYGINLFGKNVVILGHSAAVGKPLSLLMLNNNATVTVCHIHSDDVKNICKRADILVSATGKMGLVTKGYVKKGAVVVDVGISLDANGNIHGDVDSDEISKEAGYVSPVPGGVGSLTTTILAKHVIEAAKLLMTDKNRDSFYAVT